MARYTGPKIKLSRKFGEALSPKAEKYLAKRNYRPGMHGQTPARVSEFGLQLREKQKAKAVYGIMERQFRRYYQVASKRVGSTGDALLIMLEMRLDNLVYRAGFAQSRPQARQLVGHGFFEVNGKKLNIPSAELKPGETFAVREVKRRSTYIKNLGPILANFKSPEWLQLDAKNYACKVLSKPSRDQLEHTINPQLVVEYYSR